MLFILQPLDRLGVYYHYGKQMGQGKDSIYASVFAFSTLTLAVS